MNDEIIIFSTGCPKCNVLIKKLDIVGVNYTISNDVEEIINLGFTVER